MSEKEFYKCKRMHTDAIICSYFGVSNGVCRLKKPPEPFYCFFEKTYGEKSACDPANCPKVEMPVKEKKLEVDIELITKMADDVWAVAKKLEVSTESNELKTISSCLHDIRRGHETDWYKKIEVKNV